MGNKIKTFIKNTVLFFLNLIPAQNTIVFESVPDLSDNTKAVFDEMIKRGLNKKYKLIWLVSDKEKRFKKIDNVRYIDLKSKYRRLAYLWLCVRAKCLICCNGFLISYTKKQKSFYLTHGTPLKSVRSYYNVPEGIDYVIAASKQTEKLISYEFNVEPNKVLGLGFPRNDALISSSYDVHSLLGYEKVIVWYPTFRQHKSGKVTGSNQALPILIDLENAENLNEFAKEKNVLLVIKPHFAQDVSYIKNYNLSNIKFIDDSFFEENNLTSYCFVGSCDALITDYSSIYFDFLLCNKPIAVVWSDIEDYRKKPGFAVDVDYYMKGAEKIYTLDDFKAFVYNIANGSDSLYKERNEICTWANYNLDNKNAERVVNFIVEKANL